MLSHCSSPSPVETLCALHGLLGDVYHADWQFNRQTDGALLGINLVLSLMALSLDKATKR